MPGKVETVFAERPDKSITDTSATFYGIEIDLDNPYLRHNLNRLEARFKMRYEESVRKDLKRQREGKPSHKTTLKSIQDNKERLEEVRKLRDALF